MNCKYFCYNCFLSVLFLNGFEYGFVYFVFSVAVNAIIFHFIRNNTVLKIIRFVLCICAVCLLFIPLQQLTQQMLGQINLIVPVFTVLIYASLKPFSLVNRIHRYTFISALLFLLILCIAYIPKLKFEPISISSTNEIIPIFILTALPFSFSWKPSLQASPVFLAVHYLYLFSQKGEIGFMTISENINLSFIFSSLEVIFLFGLYLSAVPVLGSCVSYIFDRMADVYGRILPALKRHRLLID